MKNSQKGFIVPLLIAIIAVLVIGGGVYVYETKKAEAPAVVDTTTQQTNTQTSSVNTQADTSNWKTYTNTQYGFEFKYPVGWNVSSRYSGISTGDKDLLARYDLTSLSPGADVPESEFSVSVYSTSLEKTIIKEQGAVNSNTEVKITSVNDVKMFSLDGKKITEKNVITLQPYIFYAFENDNKTYFLDGNNTQILSTLKFTSPQSNDSVDGMQKYTDSNFGFSFWYPNTWTVQSIAIKDNYTGGTVQKTLTIAPPSDPNGLNGEVITIDEFSSPTREITIARDLCSPMSGSFVAAHRYYFDTNTHTWMVEVPAYTGQSERDGSQYSVPASTKAADVSNDTMGGLHMLGAGCSGAVIPLSAKNFVVFSFNSRNVGPYDINIAKTITATDPSVATPVSSDEQIQTITNAGVLLGAIGTKIGEWYVTNEHVYNWQGDIVVGANPSTFRLISTYSDGTTGAPYATDGVHVFAAWSSEIPVLNSADPATFVAIRQQYQIPYAPSSGAYGQSFTSYDATFAKDKSHVWYESKLIPGADPTTFVVTGDTHVQNNTGGYTLSYDAHHTYGMDAKGNFTIDGVIMQW